eukprot:SAG22_NODE_239_length_14182_cov_74.353050_1_plen_79_part_00
MEAYEDSNDWTVSKMIETAWPREQLPDRHQPREGAPQVADRGGDGLQIQHSTAVQAVHMTRTRTRRTAYRKAPGWRQC